MIIVISNREVREGATDETLFGEGPNARGLDEIRLATAEYDVLKNQWSLELHSEPDKLTENNLPSRRLFRQVLQGIDDGHCKPDWVFYIHGFNQSFRQTIDASYKISEKYNVDVIVFSWVSNPGGFVTSEYARARQAAKASSNALDRSLEKIGQYLSERSRDAIEACNVRFNLLVHSLGNYLVEQFVRNPVFSGETQIFDNVIFHQADTDHATHTEWIDRVIYGQRLYITINENDGVLKSSDLINPARLGRTAEELNARRAVYMDFTGGAGVGREHNFFDGAHGNDTIYEFFQHVLTSRRGELIDGFTYDRRTNSFVMR